MPKKMMRSTPVARGSSTPPADFTHSYQSFSFLDSDSGEQSMQWSRLTGEMDDDAADPRPEADQEPKPTDTTDPPGQSPQVDHGHIDSTADAKAWEALWGSTSFSSEWNKRRMSVNEQRKDSLSDDDDLVFISSVHEPVALFKSMIPFLSQGLERKTRGQAETATEKTKREEEDESECSSCQSASLQQQQPPSSDSDHYHILSSQASTTSTVSTVSWSPENSNSPPRSSSANANSTPRPSCLRKSSSPIDIQRPRKRVLLQLDSSIIVAPSSDYGTTSTSIDDDQPIHSAILNPRSPPQTDNSNNMMAGFNSRSSRTPNSGHGTKHWKLNTSFSSASSNEDDCGSPIDSGERLRRLPSPGQAMIRRRLTNRHSQQHLGTPVRPAHLRSRDSARILSDSEISVLDLGPSLTPRRCHQDIPELRLDLDATPRKRLIDADLDDLESVAVTSDSMSFSNQYPLAARNRRVDRHRGTAEDLNRAFELQDTKVRSMSVSAPSPSPRTAAMQQPSTPSRRPNLVRSKTSFRGMDLDFMLEKSGSC